MLSPITSSPSYILCLNPVLWPIWRGRVTKAMLGLGTYSDSSAGSEPPVPAVPHAVGQRLLWLCGATLKPESWQSNALACFCCMTNTAEWWRKDVGTAAAGLSASKRHCSKWHICFSCQTVRCALEVRDVGCDNSIYFEVLIFFYFFVFVVLILLFK